MSPFPAIKAKDFIRILERLGFCLDRQKGSHAIYNHPDGRWVIVPIHSGKDLKPGTFSGMLKDIGLTKEEFFNAKT